MVDAAVCSTVRVTSLHIFVSMYSGITLLLVVQKHQCTVVIRVALIGVIRGVISTSRGRSRPVQAS